MQGCVGTPSFNGDVFSLSLAQPGLLLTDRSRRKEWWLEKRTTGRRQWAYPVQPWQRKGHRGQENLDVSRWTTQSWDTCRQGLWILVCTNSAKTLSLTQRVTSRLTLGQASYWALPTRCAPRKVPLTHLFCALFSLPEPIPSRSELLLSSQISNAIISPGEGFPDIQARWNPTVTRLVAPTPPVTALTLLITMEPVGKNRLMSGSPTTLAPSPSEQMLVSCSLLSALPGPSSWLAWEEYSTKIRCLTEWTPPWCVRTRSERDPAGAKTLWYAATERDVSSRMPHRGGAEQGGQKWIPVCLGLCLPHRASALFCTSRVTDTVKEQINRPKSRKEPPPPPPPNKQTLGSYRTPAGEPDTDPSYLFYPQQSKTAL